MSADSGKNPGRTPIAGHGKPKGTTLAADIAATSSPHWPHTPSLRHVGSAPEAAWWSKRDRSYDTRFTNGVLYPGVSRGFVFDCILYRPFVLGYVLSWRARHGFSDGSNVHTMVVRTGVVEGVSTHTGVVEGVFIVGVGSIFIRTGVFKGVFVVGCFLSLFSVGVGCCTFRTRAHTVHMCLRLNEQARMEPGAVWL